MNRHFYTLAAASILIVSNLQTAKADILLYEQAPFNNVTGFSWTSDLDNGGNGFQSFDNFELTADSMITNVRWQGFYWDSITPGNNPVVAETVTWDISFWSDSGGEPGAAIKTENFSVASINSTFLFNGNFSGDSVPVFEFEAHLSSPIQVNGGQTYWFSTLSRSVSFNPLFSWKAGFGPDDLTIQDILPSGERLVRQGDRAFALEGRVIPEPASLVLWGLGAVLMVVITRVRWRAEDWLPIKN